MGVPKFYRWLSERYPLINQLISGTVILPEFDNLYLDMNGIIHACTHPNDNHAANSLTMREMMLSIFRYIDRIVTEIVKPKKLLFLAIDGVAPRAKLNQQRARRFRAAQDRMESIAKAKQRGEVVDESALFDSNAITPGTEFMEVVNRHLRWFIRKKMKEDPVWAGLQVIYSGHDVPGEGEHKIMTYIRDLRADPKYEPNLRHCMYGQDADLIMLALATHEPHFALLREVIHFNSGGGRGRRSAREVVMRQTQEAQFQLLHISLLREYIALDFGHSLAVPMDHERVIDDFIFLTFLVGNDFLPHLPTLDISEHAFDVLIGAYRALWAAGAGYIVENGEVLDLQRLEDLFAIIGAQEGDILARREVEKKEFKDKRRRFASTEEVEEDEEAAKEVQLAEAFELAVQQAMGKAEEKDEEEEVKQVKEKDYRGRYYYEKFRVLPATAEGTALLTQLMEDYLKGLMWCLAYYVKGCVSWTWYYPFHYGPMLQDMKALAALQRNISFALGQPFTPYQQLLGCLPPASCSLLPKCYQTLMISAESPVREFYPEDFEVDMDGKKNPWEAVVLLDFIDEARLREAEAAQCPAHKLTSSEVQRNQFGALLHHSYDPAATETYLSCNPEIGLPDILHCSTRLVEQPFSLAPGEYFKSCLMEGTEYPIAGYPSLSALPLSAVEVEAIKINVFGSDSRYRTVVVHVNAPDVDKVDSKMTEKLLGRSVFINYPHMHEAKVVGVSTDTEELSLSEGLSGGVQVVPHDVMTSNKWATLAAKEETCYLKGRNLPGTGGLAVGDVRIRIKCRPLIGMKRNPATGEATKIFSKDMLADVPIQLALWTPLAKDNRFVETTALPVEELYPLGSKVVAVRGPLKGCAGFVVGPHAFGMQEHNQRKKAQGSDTSKKRVVDVEFLVPQPAPAFGHAIAASVQEQYFGTRDVCSALRISPSLLGKIVGGILVEPGRFDLGLNLKRNGMYQLLGYARKVDPTLNKKASGVVGVPVKSRSAWTAKDSVDIIGMSSDDAELVARGVEKDAAYWEYSSKTIVLIADYMAAFPKLFHQLETLPHQPFYQIADLFPNMRVKACKENTVDPIMRWMAAQPFYHIPRTPFTTTCLSREAMAAIERAADVHTTLNQSKGMRTLVVKGIDLDHIYSTLHRTANDLSLAYNALQPALGDRVVNLSCSGVPLGLKGTVVGIHQQAKFVDIIFDEEFMGGKSLQGACSAFRGRLCNWSDLLLLHSSAVVTAPSSSAKGAKKSKQEEKEIEKALDEGADLVVTYEDCDDDGLDELFQSQDMTDVLALLAKRKPSDGSGLAKLAALAGIVMPSKRTPLAVAPALPVQVAGGHGRQNSQQTHQGNQRSQQGGQRHSQQGHQQQSTVTATNALKQALSLHKSPAAAAPAPAATVHNVSYKEVTVPGPGVPAGAAVHAEKKRATPGSQVLDKPAADRMVKHQLGVQGKPSHGDAKQTNKGGTQIMALLKKPADAAPAPAAVDEHKGILPVAPALDVPVPPAEVAHPPAAPAKSHLNSLLSKAKVSMAAKLKDKPAHTDAHHAAEPGPSNETETVSSAAAAASGDGHHLTKLLTKAKTGMSATHTHAHSSTPAAHAPAHAPAKAPHITSILSKAKRLPAASAVESTPSSEAAPVHAHSLSYSEHSKPTDHLAEKIAAIEHGIEGVTISGSEPAAPVAAAAEQAEEVAVVAAEPAVKVKKSVTLFRPSHVAAPKKK